MTPDIIQIGWEQLAIAGALIAINAAVSIAYRLALEKTLALAAIRTVVQLTAVGYLLEWIFALDTWYAVVPLLLVMTGLAAHAAVGRAGRAYPGAYVTSLGSIFVAAATSLFFGLLAVVQVDPWWTPRYAIPILGMILGNSLTGVSLALDRFVGGLVDGRAEIELLLSHGASRSEAVRALRAEAVRVGMIPIVNAMMVVGIVSLPGMMTGQILSGTSPRTAVAYQIVIMFLLAASTALGSVGIVLASERRLFGEHDRPLVERIR